MSAWCRHVLTAFVLLCAVPVTAPAQVATGKSPAGLFYEVSGTGEPIVLIHAFSVDRRMWAPQITALQGRFRVVRSDLRGHGNSDGPSAPYAPHEDLRSVLNALSIDKATLVGLSAGATIATDFAIAYPSGSFTTSPRHRGQGDPLRRLRLARNEALGQRRPRPRHAGVRRRRSVNGGR